MRIQSEEDDASEEQGGGLDVAELYAAVKPHGNEPELTGDNPRLRPTLRPYQKRAAAWMVAREEACQVLVTATHCGASAVPSQRIYLRLAAFTSCPVQLHITSSTAYCPMSSFLSKSESFSILVKANLTHVGESILCCYDIDT